MADIDTADRSLAGVAGGDRTEESRADEAADGARPGDDRRRGGTKLAYNPALDGIRGIAVAAVLLFHGGYAWARGGYLGVSTFFTLSGFLITSLLVAERLGGGRIDLRAFWARRLRRLFPASALALAAISLSALVLDRDWERGLSGDVLGALFQVANWRFLLGDQAYADLFASPSPVLHFWSLAIEEQFYWVFPVLAAGVFALAKGSLRVFAAVLGGLLVLAGILTLVYGAEHQSTVYYATPIRMGEILVGALLAVALARRPVRGKALARLVAAGGVAALVATVFAWWNLGQDSERVYEGGLLAYALASGGLVLAATVAGPVRTVLAVEPLRLLGVISYGVYLYHWPIFLVLDGERTGLDGDRLFAARVAATLAVSIASYLLLERPIRRGWRPRLPISVPMPALAGGALALVAGVAVVVPRVSEPPADPFAGAEDFADYSHDPDPASVPPDALFGLTVGDSTLFRTAWGLGAWGQDTGVLNVVGGAGGLGCSVTRGGEIRYRGNVGPTQPYCDAWEERLTDGIEVRRERYGRVDLAFVQYGPWDVSDRRLEGSDEWVTVGDPTYDAYLRSEMSEMVDVLLDAGVYVVWATAPYLDVGRDEEPPPETPYPESDPARVDRFNEIVREVTGAHEGAVVLDLQGYLQSRPGGALEATYTAPNGSERLMRPDGVHFSNESATALAHEWLGDELLRSLTLESPPPGADWTSLEDARAAEEGPAPTPGD